MTKKEFFWMIVIENFRFYILSFKLPMFNHKNWFVLLFSYYMWKLGVRKISFFALGHTLVTEPLIHSSLLLPQSAS